MKCKKVTHSREQLLDPAAKAWAGIPGEALALEGTPVAMQPSAYVRASFQQKAIGKVRSVMVQSAHNGADIFFRLTWEDASKNASITDNNVFADGCGIMMPLKGGEPPLIAMGSQTDPVNVWYWRADHDDAARNTLVQGLGTTHATERCSIQVKSLWGKGAWSVVFARALAVPDQRDETAQLAPGTPVKVGFAVWEGANRERGGLKAFSKEWRVLEIEA